MKQMLRLEHLYFLFGGNEFMGNEVSVRNPVLTLEMFASFEKLPEIENPPNHLETPADGI